MIVGRRFPQPPQHVGDDARDLVAVLGLPEPRARLAPLDEQRTALVVATEQTHRADAVPVRERVRLVLALFFRKVDLQDRRRARAELGRRDIGHVGVVERLPELE